MLLGTWPSLSMGRLYAMRRSSVTLSAILGKVVSRSFPNPSLLPCIVRISYHSSFFHSQRSVTLTGLWAFMDNELRVRDRAPVRRG